MNTPSLEALIDGMREHVRKKRPDLLPYFETYSNEARFGRRWLDVDLRKLKPGDEVLEIGAGIFLLACQLKQEGIEITALEPMGSGFDHFNHLQQLVLQYAAAIGITFPILHCTAEELGTKDRYIFAYSINVMEHVNNVKTVLKAVHAALAPQGYYRFSCPNYSFPYEPHFNMPTLFSKNLTRRILKHRIRSSQFVPDAEGMCASLNWISISKVKHIGRKSLAQCPIFDSSILMTYINRTLHDPIFQERRSSGLSTLLKLMNRVGIFALIRYIPPQMLPIMDCTIKK